MVEKNWFSWSLEIIHPVRAWRMPPSLNLRAWNLVGVHHSSSPSHYCRFSPDNLTNDWLCLGDPPVQSAQERVDEIAGQIMLLADASLITALLSISNYTSCLAGREGRWTSYWKSLYWQYSHQAVMGSLLKQPFCSWVIAAQSAGRFLFSFLIRGYFTLGMQSENN